ncbi:cell division protein SepF [Caproiciproducens sp. MSJ-32]|uniref:cell division protein SepF n=1 Tax=Caproiciproducens sp. MSJ-32 TaxID=2841527 RepID=UPI001C112A2A|nr:cell division protein SepF [Caproiciproducens sp. MSJ-32]MBU5454603.1 cell division protein SepF [Caproiciproducens sp. MSJ-32]
MANVFGKFKEMIGMGDDYEEELNEFEDTALEEEYEEEIEPIISKQKGNKVVNIHTTATTKVMITKPNNYDDAREIADAIKARKIVLVNATTLETKIAQRLVDFISGACYVLGATLQEIEQRVYLLSPSNVEVTNELKNELSSKALFNWNK